MRREPALSEPAPIRPPRIARHECDVEKVTEVLQRRVSPGVRRQDDGMVRRREAEDPLDPAPGGHAKLQ
jgi:hypothetical protein